AAIERAERLLALLLVGVAGEGEERRVERERDGVLSRDGRQALGPWVVHPEPALEVELAGGVAALEQELDGSLRRLPRGATRRAEPDRSHALDRIGQGVSESSLTRARHRARRGARDAVGTLTERHGRFRR